MSSRSSSSKPHKRVPLARRTIRCGDTAPSSAPGHLPPGCSASATPVPEVGASPSPASGTDAPLRVPGHPTGVTRDALRTAPRRRRRQRGS
jgi:hypothetical protein